MVHCWPHNSNKSYLYILILFSFQGCNLDVINLSTNERVAAWSFSNHDTADPETEITCLEMFLAEPSSVSGSGRTRVSHVVVGLDTGLHGALAVLDIAESRIVRFIALPQRVGSLSLVTG